MRKIDLKRHIDQYLIYIRSIRHLSPETVRAYTHDLNRLLAININCLDYRSLRQFIANMDQEGLSPRSINRAIATIRGFFRYLYRNGAISKNSAAMLRNLRGARNLPLFLFENEIDRFINVSGMGLWALRDRVIFELLYITGCRVSELIGINVIDIDMKYSSIWVKGKGNKSRQVYLGQPALQALHHYLPQRDRYVAKRQSTTAALIINRYAKRLTQRGVTYIIDRRASKIEFEKRISPHVFRHSFATHILNNGADIRIVQELLGHADLSTTQIYTHLNFKKIRSSYDLAHPHSRRRKKSD